MWSRRTKIMMEMVGVSAQQTQKTPTPSTNNVVPLPSNDTEIEELQSVINVHDISNDIILNDEELIQLEEKGEITMTIDVISEMEPEAHVFENRAMVNDAIASCSFVERMESSGEEYTPHSADESDSDSIENEAIKTINSEQLTSLAPLPIKSSTKQGKKTKRRWRKADPSTWKRHVQKKRRNLGLSFSSMKGEVPEKLPQKSDCSKCRFKCNDNFSEEDRRRICKIYWSLETYRSKKNFLLKNTKYQVPQRQRPRTQNARPRGNAKQFFFAKNGLSVRVCQNFFLKTLIISNGPLNKAYEKMNDAGSFSGCDMRGKHAPANKFSENTMNEIRLHINSFPITESHYCRKSSSRQYLDSSLSISKMYALFKESWNPENGEIPSLTTYKRVFGKEFNLSFFKPRKDQCAICSRFERADEQEKLSLKENYEEHKQREKEANEAKAFDKERANREHTFCTCTFDLQSVLQIPSSEVSAMYYARKISVFNLTIYEGASPNNAFCFTWSELNGKRGSAEIATCLYLYLESLPDYVTEVSLFSDTCSGQNRNQNVAAMLTYFMQYNKNHNIEILEQKFLESGHTMMECDSMHSSIEKEKRNQAVYCMNDWLNIFKRARSKRIKNQNEPYVVRELKFSDFFDFSLISKSIFINKTINTKGEKINWLKIKCLRFEKLNPNIIKYRYGYSGDYDSFNINRKKSAGRPVRKSPELASLYSGLLPISEQKKTDLMRLCKRGVVPDEFHHWYSQLPTSRALTDRNPEPSIYSEEEE